MELHVWKLDAIVRVMTAQIFNEYDDMTEREANGEEICECPHEDIVIWTFCEILKEFHSKLVDYMANYHIGHKRHWLHAYQTFVSAKAAIKIASITMQYDPGFKCIEQSWFEGIDDITGLCEKHRHVSYIHSYNDADQKYADGQLDLTL